MTYAAESDPLCYPGTSVLVNLLDITDPGLLEEAELALFLLRAEDPPAGGLDLDHYLALHRHLFQDVYAWAGQIRTIRIGKGGNWFCYPEYIERELRRVFGELGGPDLLRSMTRDAFAGHIAHFIAELNAIHPFWEGNGRTQLSFAAVIADQEGFALNASRLDPGETLEAMIESFAGDERRLARVMRDLLG